MTMTPAARRYGREFLPAMAAYAVMLLASTWLLRSIDSTPLRALLALLPFVQSDLAERLQVSRQTVNAIETGKYDPSLPLAFRIARLFGKRIETIFQYEDDA